MAPMFLQFISVFYNFSNIGFTTSNVNPTTKNTLVQIFPSCKKYMCINYRMGKVRHSKKRVYRRKTAKMTGGDCGASNWAQQVYGAAGQQHAVSSTNNTIATTNPSVPLPVVTKGGALAALSPSELGSHNEPVAIVTKGGAVLPLSPGELKGGDDLPVVKMDGGEEVPLVNVDGGSMVADLVVPAALIYARDSIRKRRIVGLPRLSMRKSKSYKRGSRRGRR